MIDVDQVDNLIKFCPTKEEAELLKVYIFVFCFLIVLSYYHQVTASFVNTLMLHLLSAFLAFRRATLEIRKIWDGVSRLVC